MHSDVRYFLVEENHCTADDIDALTDSLCRYALLV